MIKIICLLPLLLFAVSILSQSHSLNQKNEKVEVMYGVLQEMPIYPGCEEMAKDKVQCSNEKLLEYVYSNLKYPESAKEKKIEGKAILQFAIQKTGRISDIKILRDPGEGMGKAAAKVLMKMKNDEITWTPGKQSGKPENVLYTLPIIFKLENESQENAHEKGAKK